MKNIIIFLGLASFERKNADQLKVMNKKGWRYAVFTADTRRDSLSLYDEYALNRDNKLFMINSKINRMLTLIKFFIKNKSSIHHIEAISTGGQSNIIAILMGKIFNVPVLLVERGAIRNFNSNNLLTKMRYIISYRFAALVWYKEPYMLETISKYGSKYIFLPNACFIPTSISSYDERRIDFLWANRVIPERGAILYVKALNDQVFRNTNNVLLGFQDQKIIDQEMYNLQKDITEICPSNITILPYINPFPYMEKAKFFVLLGKQVFGNNALFEAMARGVVPIVSRSNGIELLIKNGFNGFIVENKKNELNQVMEKVLKLDIDEWERLSFNARETVLNHYNIDTWSELLDETYKKL